MRSAGPAPIRRKGLLGAVALWFTGGETLRPAPRIAVGILSLLFAAAGLLLSGDFMVAVQQGNWRFWIPGLGAIICLVVGISGLKNVLQFRRANSPDRSNG